jgi:hypothetical protein
MRRTSQEAFYSVPWWTKADLTGKVLTDEQWAEGKKKGIYGYHFWSKLLFLENVDIKADSAAARVLDLTCHEGMACLYKSDAREEAMPEPGLDVPVSSEEATQQVSTVTDVEIVDGTFDETGVTIEGL